MLLPRDDTICRFFFTSSTAVRAAGADSETPPPAGRNLSQRLGLLRYSGRSSRWSLSHDLFDQGVLLEHLRLRLHVDRIVGAGGRGGIDVAKVQEIVIDSLDLDGRLGLVYARLGDAKESGGDDAEERRSTTRSALRRYNVRAQSMTLVSWPPADGGREFSRSGDGSPGGMWKGTVQPRQFRINSPVILITSSIATAFSGATTTRALTSQR